MRRFSKFLSIMLVLAMLVPAMVDASKLTENIPGDALGEAHIVSEVDLQQTDAEELNEEKRQEDQIVQPIETDAKNQQDEVQLQEDIDMEIEEQNKVEAQKNDENEILLDEKEEVALLNSTLNVNSYIKRIDGKNRVETSINVSNQAYPNGAGTVLLAGYDGQADALTATFVAGQMDAPLLLTYKDRLDDNLVKELQRLKPKNVIILGGKNAVFTSVKTDLKSKGFNAQRIEGKNRIETATNVVLDYYSKGGANKKVSEVFVVEYDSLADALAVGPVAAKKGIPVLLTKKDEVPTEVVKFLQDKKPDKITIIGGENAVSETGKQALKKHVANVGRISGKNREETSIKICEDYFKVSDGVVVANGFKYTDALVGGYFAAKMNAPILLTSTNKVNKPTLDCIANTKTNTYVLGGTSIISGDMFESIAQITPKPVEPPKPKPDPVPEVKNPIVCLDYGHGGSDPGAGYQGRQEKTDTIKMGKLVAAELRRHGVQVDETRKGDEYVSLQDRVKFANKKDYNYFVSFHRNAFIPEKAHGVETWTSNPASWKSTKLAKSIQESLVGVGFNNRGVKEKNFYVVRWTKAPAVLIELGFIDHTIDNQIYDTKQAQIVKAVTTSILGELGITYKNK